MTAEVAIMNRIGVALAADSAATAGQKVHDSADKLFEVSPGKPIAVMIYGSAMFTKVPWDTVVATNPDRHLQQEHALTEDYVTNFLQHIDDLANVVWRDAIVDYIKSLAIWELGALNMAAFHRSNEQERLDHSLDAIVSDCIQDRIHQIRAMPDDWRVTDASTAEALVGECIEDWDQFIEGNLHSRPPVSDTIWAQARQILVESLQVVKHWPLSTGVVIAGFGSDEIFPSLYHFLVDGAIGGRARYLLQDSVHIGADYGADVRIFAQGEPLVSFLLGIHPYYRQAFSEFFASMMSDHEQKVAKIVSGQKLRQLSDMFRNIVEDYESFAHDASASRYHENIIPIIETMPKRTLAEMASTLVNLASFELRITHAQETVGGPIDVAVLSKLDGFRWVRRKSYVSDQT